MKDRQVLNIQGTAHAVDAQGRRRALRSGDHIREGERIDLEPGGHLTLRQDDGRVESLGKQEAPVADAAPQAWQAPSLHGADAPVPRARRQISALDAALLRSQPEAGMQAGVQPAEGGHGFTRVARLVEPLNTSYGKLVKAAYGDRPFVEEARAAPAEKPTIETGSVSRIGEHKLKTRGQLSIYDPDNNQSWYQEGVQALDKDSADYGTMSFDPKTMIWTFVTAQNSKALHALNPQEEKTLRFQFLTADGHKIVHTLVIVGENDGAKISGQVDGKISEHDAWRTVSGTLTVADADAGHNGFQPQLLALDAEGKATSAAAENVARYGEMTLNPETGLWTFVGNDSDAWHALPEGQVELLKFRVTSFDGSASQDIEVRIEGKNDVAEISGKPLVLSEDDTQGSGQLSIRDLDKGQAQFQTRVVPEGDAGKYGELRIDTQGNRTFVAHDSAEWRALQSMKTGEFRDLSFTVYAQDGTPYRDTVRIEGRDDGVKISGGLNLSEDDEFVEGQLTIETVDKGQNHFSGKVQALDGAERFGMLEIDENGATRFVPSFKDDWESLQEMVTGESRTLFYRVTTVGGAAYDVPVVVHGVDGVATILGAKELEIQEHTPGTTEMSGMAYAYLSVKDEDRGQNKFRPTLEVLDEQGVASASAEAAARRYGLGSFDPEKGVMTFTPGGDLWHALAKDEVHVLRYRVTSADGSATEEISVTIKGQNDLAVISGQTRGEIREGAPGAQASGTLTVQDLDHDQSRLRASVVAVNAQGQHSAEIENEALLYGQMSLDVASGKWTFTGGGERWNKLPLNQSKTLYYQVSSADGATTQVVAVEIIGQNCPASITGDISRELKEHTPRQAVSGKLNVVDEDDGQSSFDTRVVAVDANGETSAAIVAETLQYGSMRLHSNGNWYFEASGNAKWHALKPGEIKRLYFMTTSSDQSARQIVTVVLEGEEDIPTISGKNSADIYEHDSPPHAEGRLVINDPDEGDSVFDRNWVVVDALGKDDLQEGQEWAVGPLYQDFDQYGRIELNPVTGEWKFIAYQESAAWHALVEGEQKVLRVRVSAKDGQASKIIALTLHGQNDVPTTGGKTSGELDEHADQARVAGKLTIEDLDRGQSSYRPELVVLGADGHADEQAAREALEYGHMVFKTDGSWAFIADGPLWHQLKQGENRTFRYQATSFDGSATQIITVKVIGRDDPAAITGQDKGTADEDQPGWQVSGKLDISDLDRGQNKFLTTLVVVDQDGNESADAAREVQRYGNMTFNEHGEWCFTGNGGALWQSLGQGQEKTFRFRASSFDQGTTKIIEVKLVGQNDPASIRGNASAEIDEHAPQTGGGGKLEVIDPDQNENRFRTTLQVVDANGNASDELTARALRYGNMVLKENGEWKFSANNSDAWHELGLNESETLYYRATSHDGTASKDIAVKLVGQNDLARIHGLKPSDTVAQITEHAGDLGAEGRLIVKDLDRGQNKFQPKLEVLNDQKQVSTEAEAEARSFGEMKFNWETGAWKFIAKDGDAWHGLKPGQSKWLYYRVTSVDGTASQEVAVEIVGQQDLASIHGQLTGEIYEEARKLEVRGKLWVEDRDAGEATFRPTFEALKATLNEQGEIIAVSVDDEVTRDTAQYGRMSYDERTREWVFIGTGNKAWHGLEDRQEKWLYFRATSADGSASEVVRVLIRGENEPPTGGSTDLPDDDLPDENLSEMADKTHGRGKRSLSEAPPPVSDDDALVLRTLYEHHNKAISGEMWIKDDDNNQSYYRPGIHALTPDADKYGTMTFDAGTRIWRFTPKRNSPELHALVAGEEKALDYYVLSADGHAFKRTVVLIGENDPATIARHTLTVNQGEAQAEFSLGLRDLDRGQERMLPRARFKTQYGECEVIDQDTVIYRPDYQAERVQALRQGETLNDEARVKSLDGTEFTVNFNIVGQKALDPLLVTSDPVRLNESDLTSDTLRAIGEGAISVSGSPDTVRLVGAPTQELFASGRKLIWTLSADGQSLSARALGEERELLRVDLLEQGARYKVSLFGALDHSGGKALLLPLDLDVSKGGTSSREALKIEILDSAPNAKAEWTELAGASATNLLLILDVSGSMRAIDQGKTRIQWIKESVSRLLDQYGNAGEVKANLVLFNGETISPFKQWVGAEDVRNLLKYGVLDRYAAQEGDTLYLPALTQAMTQFSAHEARIAGAKTVAYFMSDGEPSKVDGQAAFADWEAFKTLHAIKTYAMGMGPNISDAQMQQLAVLGEPFRADDPQSLPDASAEQAPSLLQEGWLGHLGADGGYLKQLNVLGRAYSFAPASHGAGVALIGKLHADDSLQNSTLFVNSERGVMTVNLTSAQFSFTHKQTGGAPIALSYALADRDGSESQHAFALNPRASVHPVAAPPAGLNVLWATEHEVNGSAQNDFIRARGAGRQLIRAGDGDDTVIGNHVGNTMMGGRGFNVLYGGDGPDSLRDGVFMHGGGGADTLYADSKGSVMQGGKGNDILNGSIGRDTFAWTHGDLAKQGGPNDPYGNAGYVDKVYLFNPNDDRLDFHGVLKGLALDFARQPQQLGQYLSVALERDDKGRVDTSIDVRTATDPAAGHYFAQTVLLKGVNLYDAYAVPANQADSSQKLLELMLKQETLVV